MMVHSAECMLGLSAKGSCGPIDFCHMLVAPTSLDLQLSGRSFLQVHEMSRCDSE